MRVIGGHRTGGDGAKDGEEDSISVTPKANTAVGIIDAGDGDDNGKGNVGIGHVW
jgi:hypothetical protein